MSLDTAAAAISDLEELVPGAHSRALLRAVLDSVGEGLWLQTRDQVLMNEAARNLLALTADTDLTGIPVKRLDGTPIPRDEHPAVKAFKTAEPVSFTVRADRLDGVERIFSGTAAPVREASGSVIGTVLIFRDVTEERNRAHMNTQLLRRGYDLLPTAALATHLESGAIVSANRAFSELSGFTRDEIVGLEEPFPWNVSQPAAPEPGARFESTFRHKDGSLIPVEIVPFDVRGPGGGIAVQLVTDLSQRRDLEERLIQSGKLAAIGELASGVAHEINNPLFAILGLAEFLLRDAEPGSKAHQRVSLILQTGHEIREIVRALLDFAREQSDTRMVVSLPELAQLTAELVRKTSAGLGVEIVERYPEEPTLVEAIPGQIKQVFLSLLGNARQAMPGGGVATIEVRREPGWIVAEVSDTGSGIPEDVLPRIFEPFFTTRRESGGTGLGLSVSHGIVAAHGGTITASSEVRCGTTLTVRLPEVAR